MTALQQAVEHLIAKIQQAKQTTHRVMVQLDLPIQAELIDWMENQPVFPKFYWQSRDGQEEVVALGQVKTFTDPLAAEKVIHDDQRVWGGRSFDGRTDRNRRCLSAFFFLPQFEIMRHGQTWSVAINLGDDYQKVLDGLAKLRFSSVVVDEISSRIVNRTYAPDFSGWASMIGQALDAISHKVFEKVVLARRTTLQLDTPVTPAQMMKASRANNSNSFHFMMALDAQHCFIGSTPERLFQRHDHALQTEALAGTIGRGKTAREDDELASWLMNDNKNGYENQLVVDDIVSRLNSCSHSLHVAHQPELVRLRKVQHIKRHIEAELNPQVFNTELLHNLQPTAAIAGLPREKAMEFISEHEPFSRGWYSGAVGYLSRQHSEFCVAIRSALIAGEELHLFAGAGIVPGSDPSSEWKELNRKTSTLCSLFESLPSDIEAKKASMMQLETWEQNEKWQQTA